MSALPKQRPMITVPWTPEQVEALKRHQADPTRHPYTCPGERCIRDDDRVLIPTREGWLCVCGSYTQKWAFDPL